MYANYVPFDSERKYKTRGLHLPKSLYIVAFILIVGVVITFLNVLQLRTLQKEVDIPNSSRLANTFQHYEQSHKSFPEGDLTAGQKMKPVYWLKAKRVRCM